jgi:hypothetical protein
MLVNDTRVQSKGNLDAERIAMGIDQASLAHIMDVLTNLYSDKAMAIIREYSTNALDSHIAAGNSDPILVTLPTASNPVFVVQDFGLGLSYDDIVNIYSMYGASTKRDTNEQVGMLGLGCKSALTYTNQFTLDCVKDGERTIVSVSRSDDGTGGLDIIARSQTDLPNGVKVSIPVRYDYTFANKATQFFSYWEEGTILLDGQKPQRVDGNWIADDIVIANGNGPDIVVMGNVPYPVPQGILTTSYQNHIVAFAPIGAVDFTPSRESLHYTSRTKKFIEALTDHVEKIARRLANEDISKATNGGEAARAIQLWRPVFPGVQFTWRGHTDPQRINPPYSYRYQKDDTIGAWQVNLDYADLEANKSFTLYTNVMDNVMFVTGLNVKSVAHGHRRRVKKYVEDNGLTKIKKVVFCEERFGDVWTADCPEVSFDTIKAIKVPPVAGAKDSSVPTYQVFSKADGKWKQEWVEDIPDVPVVLYYSNAEEMNHELMRNAFDLPYVVLGRNRWDKLEREYPQCSHYLKHVQSEIKEVLDSLTTYDRLEIAGRWKFSTIRELNPDLVADPELADLARSLRGGSRSRAYTRWVALSRLASKVPEVEIDFDDVINRYPLLDSSAIRNNPEHVYAYIKAFAPKEDK